jgi:hypothetical protein
MISLEVILEERFEAIDSTKANIPCGHRMINVDSTYRDPLLL